MRKLMYLTIGFVISLACCLYFFQPNQYFWLIVIGLAGGIVTLLIKKYFRYHKEVLGILLGCTVAAVGLICFDRVYLAPVRSYDAKTIPAAIEITDYSYQTEYGVVADGMIDLEGKDYKVRVYTESEESLSPGDRVEGEFLLRITVAGGQQEATYHQGNGIFLLAYAKKDIKIVRASSVPLKYFAAQMRMRILQTLDSVFPDDTQAFARALLLGDSSGLTYEEDNAFKISGIRHIIAVSGLHVSILFSLVYILAGKRRVMTAVLGIPSLIFFAAIAGFTPSVVRACVMQGLLIIALLLNKEYDPPTALSFAVLTMLIVNPLAITSVSLQLSAGCMVGIFQFSSKISGYILHEKRLGPAKGKSLKARLARWFAGSVSVSVSAMITTVPLCAYYFGMVSLIGILTNLLTLWVVSFIFYGIMAACLFGCFWPACGQIIAWLISWLIRYVTFASKLLSQVPFAAVYTCSIYTVFWLIFTYILLCIFVLIKDKRPVVLTCCIGISLAVSILASCIEPRLDDFRMTALDVGQGQCILLQSKGKNYLVDCGGENENTVATDVLHLLYSQGIRKLDGIVLTHYDDDHSGSILQLLTGITTDAIYVTNPDPDSRVDEELMNQYPDTYICVTEKTELKSDSSLMTIYPAESGKTGNESSLCVLFQTKNCDILITGDRNTAAEKALIEHYPIPEVDILVAGHHGSKSSTSLALLNRAKPRTVIISVGEGNSFGHPDKEVIDRLDMFDCDIYRTDVNGTIVLRR